MSQIIIVSAFSSALFYVSGSHSENGILASNASLSSIEIEALLREKVRAKPDSIKQVGAKCNSLHAG